MATVAASPRPSSAQASHEPLVLPLLPEMQAARPPTAPSRRPPDDNSSRQVPDDYFTLPRIETATRMAEDPNPYQPPQAAVSTRVPGSKLAKTGEGLDVSKGGDGGVRSPQREAVSLKDRGDAAGPDLGVSRSSALDATLDGRESAEPNAGAQRSGDTGSAAPETGTRVGSVAQEKKAARRGPLPSQVRKHQEKDGFAARLAGATGPHPGERKGEFSSVGKADATVGRDDHGEVIVTDEGHGVGVPQTETPEQRLDRIRQSNVRNNYNTKAGDGKDALLGLTKKDANEVSNLNPSSPRRARQADHEFGYKTTFYEEMPEIMDDKASRRGQMLAAPYGKNMGLHQPLEPLEPFEIKMQIRITQLRYVEKAAPDLEAKPPPALSVESGDAAKNKDMSNTPEMVSGSDETARGENGAGRKEWYGDVGKRTPVVRFAQHGSDGGSDATEFRLQPATAHGVDVGFERTMAYSQKRSQGVQLDQKDLGLDNYQTPSGGYVPSQPDRTKHMGSDGTRAQVSLSPPTPPRPSSLPVHSASKGTICRRNATTKCRRKAVYQPHNHSLLLYTCVFQPHWGVVNFEKFEFSGLWSN